MAFFAYMNHAQHENGIYFSGSPFWMDDPKKILLHGRLTKIIYAAIFTLLYDFNRPPRRENSTISPSAS